MVMVAWSRVCVWMVGCVIAPPDNATVPLGIRWVVQFRMIKLVINFWINKLSLWIFYIFLLISVLIAFTSNDLLLLYVYVTYHLPSRFIKVNIIYYCRGFTVRVNVKVAPMARTALWSAPVKTLSTAHQLTGLASARRVKKYSHRNVMIVKCLIAWQSMLDLLTDPWMHDWSKNCEITFYVTWLSVLCVSPGWRGPDCSTPCSEGTWGPGCNATCHCANGAKCNPADGSCTCTAGWQRAHCDQPCQVKCLDMRLAWPIFVNEVVQR